mgnify:CR=1 FL=1
MKFRGIVETKEDFQTFDFEGITRDQAKSEMRRELQRKPEAGVTAELYEIHRADADLICKWKVDSNLIISESFMI